MCWLVHGACINGSTKILQGVKVVFLEIHWLVVGQQTANMSLHHDPVVSCFASTLVYKSSYKCEGTNTDIGGAIMSWDSPWWLICNSWKLWLNECALIICFLPIRSSLQEFTLQELHEKGASKSAFPELEPLLEEFSMLIKEKASECDAKFLCKSAADVVLEGTTTFHMKCSSSV